MGGGASRNDNKEIAKFLISKGANIGKDVNAKNEFGETALFIAVINENVEMTKLLIDNGADVNAKDRVGSTALNYANSAIILKCDTINKGKDKQIMDFLIDKGEDVNAKDKAGKTALDYAKAVKTLDKNGAERKAQANKILENAMQKTKKKKMEKSKNNYEMGGI